MVEKQAEEQKHTVDRGFYPNKKNIVQQKSYGCENLGGEHKTLTTALNKAETRMNSAFAGGGVSNFKPHKAFTYIIQKCNRLNVLSSYSLNVFKRNTS